VTVASIRSAPALRATVASIASGPALLTFVWWRRMYPDDLTYCAAPFFSIHGTWGDMLWFTGVVLTVWGLIVGFLRLRSTVWSLDGHS
jgi:hypothetical protein